MRKEEKSLQEKLVESRILIICGSLSSADTADLVFNLVKLSAKDEKKEIQLFINGYGGSYLDAMAVYDILQTIPNPVSGVCVGIASGYAALLLAGCTKGRRFALRHSAISFEQPYGVLKTGVNQQTEIAIEAKEVAMERAVFEKILSEKTGKTLEEVHMDCEKGMELSADEALAYGIIDEVLA